MDHPEALIPYEDLARAVLVGGLADLSSPNHSLRRDAKRWIFKDDDFLASTWCLVAGVQVEFYRGIARQMIARRLLSGTSLPS